jgi:hypothetical protein
MTISLYMARKVIFSSPSLSSLIKLLFVSISHLRQLHALPQMIPQYWLLGTLTVMMTPYYQSPTIRWSLFGSLEVPKERVLRMSANCPRHPDEGIDLMHE